MLQKIRKILQVAQVVDGDDVDVGVIPRGAQKAATYSAETVYRDTNHIRRLYHAGAPADVGSNEFDLIHHRNDECGTARCAVFKDQSALSAGGGVGEGY